MKRLHLLQFQVLSAKVVGDEFGGIVPAAKAILDSTSNFSSSTTAEGRGWPCGAASKISTLSELRSNSISSERSCISLVSAMDCNSEIDIRSNS